MRRPGTTRGEGSRGRRAFTLVEVVVSLALAAIILPVALNGVSLALGLAGSARRQVEATSLAETRLNEMLATEEWRNGDLKGDFGEDYPEYRWSAEVSDWQEPTVRQVTVEVTWVSRGRERAVALATLAYAGGS